MKSRLLLIASLVSLALVKCAHIHPPFLSRQHLMIIMVSNRATNASKHKGPPTPEPKRPPLPLRFSRKCPFTFLMVDKEEHPGAFMCRECSLWYGIHGYDWSIEWSKHLVCKGGHKEDEVAYKNKYEWAQKKLKYPFTK
jgi:hypothetical protein